MFLKKRLFLLIAFYTSCFVYVSNAQTQKQALRTIVIDAGHGGKDYGAAGHYSYEKDVTLAIALKLQTALAEAMPDVNLVMTRTTDVFDPVTLKAEKANQAKGDLFVCIHANSVPPIRHSELTGYKMQTFYRGKGKRKKKYTKKVPQYRYWTTPNPAQGTETYIWGADRNDEKQVAMRENASLYIDSNEAEKVVDFDPNSPEQMIQYTLRTKQFFTRSANLALTIEQEFTKIGRVSREAKQRQKGIWVLQATAMPSVLIETGYISNPEEEDYLNSDKGQNELVSAIVNALKRYKYSLENHTLQNVTPATLENKPVTQENK